MTRLRIDRIALKLHGISSETAQAAMEGLDTALLQRMQMRGMDHSALSGLANTLRLPAIHALMPLDAESLRAKLADGLIDLLMSETQMNSSNNNSTTGGNT